MPRRQIPLVTFSRATERDIANEHETIESYLIDTYGEALSHLNVTRQGNNLVVDTDTFNGYPQRGQMNRNR